MKLHPTRRRPGYFSEKNVIDATDAGVDVLIATERLKHDEQMPAAPRGPIPKDATVKEKMARRLRTKAGKADCARRKAIVEPGLRTDESPTRGGHPPSTRT